MEFVPSRRATCRIEPITTEHEHEIRLGLGQFHRLVQVDGHDVQVGVEEGVVVSDGIGHTLAATVPDNQHAARSSVHRDHHTGAPEGSRTNRPRPAQA